MHYRNEESRLHGCTAHMLTKNMKISTKRRIEKDDTSENAFEIYQTNENPSKLPKNGFTLEDRIKEKLMCPVCIKTARPPIKQCCRDANRAHQLFFDSIF